MTPHILLVIAVLIQIAATVRAGMVALEFAREGDLASAKVAAIFVGLGLVTIAYTVISAVRL